MGRKGKTQEYKDGDSVFVRHDKEAWVRGNVTRNDGTTLQVKTQFGTISCSIQDVEYCSTSPAEEANVNDMTLLPDLHRPALLSSLNERFKKDKIYTFCGKILIAINPFKDLKLYGPKKMQKYMNADVQERELLPPHAYAIAHDAFDAMRTYSGRNQSILVSGESGAGKTVSTKIVMAYLTTVASRSQSKGSSGQNKISQRTLEANPLMEAFGNAKTLRNDNSSRFGKLIQLQFSSSTNALESACIDIYLLEKARVVHQMQGERNYHIFYELDQGLSKAQKKELMFPNLRDCQYTSSGTYQRADIADSKQFNETLIAMDVIGLTKEERDSIFRLVVAILHLGNISFDPINKDGAEGSRVSKSSRTSLESCAKLLYVSPDELEKGLVTRPFSIGGGGGAFAALAKVTRAAEALTKHHTPEQALEARDAMAMGLYDRLFGWITWRINESIGEVSDGMRPKSGKLGAVQKSMGKGGVYYNDYSIGCLDIFGFEVFEKNSFEQLLINYANESLQAQFNDFVFEREQKEYMEEGIDWTKVDFPDNKRCLEMIEARPIGMISLIDEECLMPRGTDRSLAAKLYDNLGRKFGDYFLAERQEKVNNQFIVKHFAGPVLYTVDAFCMKNKNELRQGIVDCMRTSKNPLFQILLPADAGSAGGGADSAEYFSQMNKRSSKRNHRSSLERRQQVPASKLQQKTVAAHFKTQLNIAMTHIRASQPHYIRCIKSTDLNIPDVFDRPRVEEQLSYAGVLEVVRVARAGYATRFNLEEFASRFAVLAHKSVRNAAVKAQKVLKKGNAKSIRGECEKILGNSGLEFGEDYQIGKTKVFLRSHAFTQLEVAKADRVRKYVVTIQRAYRAHMMYQKVNKKAIEKRKRKQEERRRKEEERKRKEEEKRRKEEERKRKEAERIRKQEEEARLREEEERRRKSLERREEEERRRLSMERKRLSEERRERLRWEEEERKRKSKERRERLRREEEMRQRELERQQRIQALEQQRVKLQEEETQRRKQMEEKMEKEKQRKRKSMERRQKMEEKQRKEMERIRQQEAMIQQEEERIRKEEEERWKIFEEEERLRKEEEELRLQEEEQRVRQEEERLLKSEMKLKELDAWRRKEEERRRKATKKREKEEKQRTEKFKKERERRRQALDQQKQRVAKEEERIKREYEARKAKEQERKQHHQQEMEKLQKEEERLRKEEEELEAELAEQMQRFEKARAEEYRQMLEEERLRKEEEAEEMRLKAMREQLLQQGERQKREAAKKREEIEQRLKQEAEAQRRIHSMNLKRAERQKALDKQKQLLLEKQKQEQRKRESIQRGKLRREEEAKIRARIQKEEEKLRKEMEEINAEEIRIQKEMELVEHKAAQERTERLRLEEEDRKRKSKERRERARREEEVRQKEQERQQRIQALEQQRLRLREEEKKRRLETEAKMEKEKQRKRKSMERRKKLEEKQRKEMERIRQQEALIKQEEERIRKEEEERWRIFAEEERVRKEEEKIRLQEEERRVRQEEERLLKSEMKLKELDAWRRKEEERRQKADKKRQKEEKQRTEAFRKERERRRQALDQQKLRVAQEEERIKQEIEARKAKEEERKKRHQKELEKLRDEEERVRREEEQLETELAMQIQRFEKVRAEEYRQLLEEERLIKEEEAEEMRLKAMKERLLQQGERQKREAAKKREEIEQRLKQEAEAQRRIDSMNLKLAERQKALEEQKQLLMEKQKLEQRKRGSIQRGKLRREEEAKMRARIQKEEERLQKQMEDLDDEESKIREEMDLLELEEKDQQRLAQEERQRTEFEMEKELMERRLKEMEETDKKKAKERINKDRSLKRKEELLRKQQQDHARSLEEKRRFAEEKRQVERSLRRQEMLERKSQMSRGRKSAGSQGKRKHSKEWAAVTIQRMVRGVLARKRMERLLKTRRGAAKMIKRAYRRKLMRDRLHEIRQESLRQRAAVALHGIGRQMKSDNNKVADMAARQLQTVARVIAVRKTPDMMLEEAEELDDAEGMEIDGDQGQLTWIVLLLLFGFLLSNQYTLPPMAFLILVILLGGSLNMEAKLRQRELDAHTKMYSQRRARGYSDDTLDDTASTTSFRSSRSLRSAFSRSRKNGKLSRLNPFRQSSRKSQPY